MAKHDKSDMPGIGIVDGKPNVVDPNAPRWRPQILDDPESAEKDEVNYRQGDGDEVCGMCTMFVAGDDGVPDRCTAVRGEIEADMVCDLFELNDEEMPES